MSNESVCKQHVEAWAPAQAVSQASFLLETITSSIARSKSPQQPATQTSTDEQPIHSVIADPFQIDTTSETVRDTTSTTGTLSAAISNPKTTKDIESHGATAQSHAVTQETGLLDDSDTPKSHSSTASNLLSIGGTTSFSAIPESLDHIDSKTLQQPSTKSSLEAAPASSAQFDILTSLVNVAAGHNDPGEQLSGTFKNTVPHEVKGSYTSGPSHDSDLGPAALPTITAVPSYTSRYADGGMHASQTTTGGSSSGSLSMLFPPKGLDTYTDGPPSTLGGSQSAKFSNAEYIIGEQTLKPGGPAVTLSGTVVSLVPGATAVVIDSSTSSITSPLGIGSYILAGIGGVAPIAGDIRASTLLSTEEILNEPTGTPTGTPEVPNSRGGVVTTVDTGDGEIVTGPISAVISVTTNQEAMHSGSTSVPSTSVATRIQGKSSGADNSATSEARSDTSSTTAPASGATSFGQRLTNPVIVCLGMAFSLCILAGWLS